MQIDAVFIGIYSIKLTVTLLSLVPLYLYNAYLWYCLLNSPTASMNTPAFSGSTSKWIP